MPKITLCCSRCGDEITLRRSGRRLGGLLFTKKDADGWCANCCKNKRRTMVDNNKQPHREEAVEDAVAVNVDHEIEELLRVNERGFLPVQQEDPYEYYAFGKTHRIKARTLYDPDKMYTLAAHMFDKSTVYFTATDVMTPSKKMSKEDLIRLAAWLEDAADIEEDVFVQTLTSSEEEYESESWCVVMAGADAAHITSRRDTRDVVLPFVPVTFLKHIATVIG